MTLGELHFLLARLNAAGCSGEQLVAAAKAAADWKLEQKLLRAVRKALAPESAVADAPQRTPAKMNNADSADPGVRIAPEPVVAPVQEPGAGTAARGSTKGAARAALLMRPGLSPAARRVGGHIVESFNLATGRCFPTIAALREAAGLASDRSVRRALAQLEAAGLIRRRIHGAGRANAYQPDWPALRAAAAAAGNQPATMNNPDSGAPIRTLLSTKPDQRVRQNPGIKPVEIRVRGRHRARGPDGRQRELLLPLPTPDKGDVAWGAAGDRLWQAVHGHFSGAGDKAAYAAAVGNIPPALWELGQQAEMRCRGNGLGVVLQGLATGPPPDRRTG